MSRPTDWDHIRTAIRDSEDYLLSRGVLQDKQPTTVEKSPVVRTLQAEVDEVPSIINNEMSYDEVLRQERERTAAALGGTVSGPTEDIVSQFDDGEDRPTWFIDGDEVGS